MPTAIFEAVLGNLAAASLLAVIALAVGRWTHRPALAHAMWLLVLVKLLTPPMFTVPIRCLPARVETPEVAPVSVPVPSSVAQPSSPTRTAAVEPVSLPVAASQRPRVLDSSPTIPEATTPPIAVSPPARNPWAWLTLEAALLGVCASGSVLFLAITLRRVSRFSRLLKFATNAPPDLVEEVAELASRMGLRRVPRVRVVPGGIAPMLWAIGWPTLYFPAGLLQRLTPEQRSALISHELAHLRRWDHVVRLIEFAALALYWWCPLAWLARRELRRLEEEACDAEVLATTPGSGYAYASAILETIDYLAGVVPAPALASGIGDATSLRRRLVLILASTPPSRTQLRTRLVLVIAGLAMLAVAPKFDRLAAAVKEAVALPEEVAAPRVAALPVPSDELLLEAVQFLPTPARLLDAAQLGSGPSHASALSPDGTRLAVAVGASVRVFDPSTKRLLFTLDGHDEVVNAVAFSPGGTRIATASNDSLAIIWDAASGKRLQTLRGHDRWVLALAFSPDGRTLATGSYDKTVRLWDVPTGAPKATWSGHAGGVRSVAFSPDGRTIATGGADNEVRLWDVARGTTTHTLKKHQAAVRVVAFSPDGTRLASGSEDRTLQVWHPHDGREIGQAVALPDYATAITFSRRGQALYAGTVGGHLLHVNPINGQLRGYVGVEAGQPAGSPAHAEAVTAILAPPDGKALYTVSQERVAFAWPSAGPPQTAHLTFRGGHPLTAVALSPDGRMLATAGQDGVIHLWEAATARELLTLPGHPGGVSALMFGTGGRLVSAGADEQVRVWDTTTGRATATVIQPTADLVIAISPDGGTLAIGGRNLPGIRLMNLFATGKPRRFAEWAGDITAIAFTPAGDRIATGYKDGFVRLWDVRKGEEVGRGKAGVGSVDGLSFNAAGTTIAAVVNAGPRADAEPESQPTHEVVFLDSRDGTVIESQRSLAHPSPITAVAFTGQDAALTAAHDGNLYVWNLGSGRVTRIIRGHVDAVRGVALTADGTAVFTAGDRTAKKWPLDKGK